MATDIQISGETATVVSTQGSHPPADITTPLIKFPPFPEIPAGVSIIPFSQFRPKGIKKRRVPDPDYPDLDGHGRPTVKLKVAHATTSSDKWKKKKRRLGEGDDGVVRKYVWHEEWAKDEDSRKTSVDHSMPLADRLIQATLDFKERPWGPVNFRLNETFDAFRVYAGLLSSRPLPALNKGAENGSDDDDDDLEEEMAAYTPITDPTKAHGDPYPLTDASEAERHVETKEERAMRDFLEDPERSLKIFFTSYFIDKGLMWKESRCVDAPELARFFVSFLIRNNVYSDVPLNDKLKSCLKLLETARKELSATFAISRALDDPFSKGCNSLWGRIIQTIDLGEDYAEPLKTQEMEELESAIIDHEKITSREGTWANIGEEIEGGDNTNSWETWGQSQPEGAGWEGWGSNAVEGGWGSTNKEFGSFGDDPESGWNVGPLPTLTTLLGPTNLPLTHTTGIFEFSMRKIVDLIPPSSVTRAESLTGDSPADGVEEALDGRFGKIVLGPWIGWDCGKETILDKPTILQRSRGPVKSENKDDQGAKNGHDPCKDNITVLVEPSILGTMIIGVGVAGNWVQITRADEDGNPVGGGRDMWYMEQVTQVIPSFYLA